MELYFYSSWTLSVNITHVFYSKFIFYVHLKNKPFMLLCMNKTNKMEHSFSPLTFCLLCRYE